MRSKSWDTRIAAAKAIGCIAENAPKFEPNASYADVKAEHGTHDELAPAQGFLQLENLDVAAVLTHGKKLLGSGGKEYDYVLAGLDPGERLAHLKKTLNARLGLDGEVVEDDLLPHFCSTEKPQNGSTASGLPRVNTAVGSLYSQDTTQSPSPFTAGSRQVPSPRLHIQRRRVMAG